MDAITKTAYRVYLAPDGCDPSYCGEYSTIEEARDVAEREPAGLDACMWETARAAGHCGGMTAPDTAGREDRDPLSWHGASGNHCVVRVMY